MGSSQYFDVLVDDLLHDYHYLYAEALILMFFFQRRDTPVVEEEEEEEESQFRYSRSSHSSQDCYVQTDNEERFVLLSDASTQVLDWQSFSNDELHDELAFRLSDYQFAMRSRHAVPLVRCYERKDVYKRWGATYNGDAKQWYHPPGTDFRALLRAS